MHVAVLVLLVLVLPLTIFLAKQQQTRQYVEASSIILPPDGQGLYDACLPSDATCLSHLDQMASAGFKLVVNYSQLYASDNDQIAYANHAASLGMKVIWAMNDPAFWNGTSLKNNYTALAATCNCSDNAGFTAYFVNLVKNLPGTWGYYVGDEVDPSNSTAVKVFTDLVKQTDPNHPRLFITDPSFASQTDSMISPFANTADVLGVDYYPVGRTDIPNGVNATADIANSMQVADNKYGKQSAMVLQAHWLGLYSGFNYLCSPFPSCVPYPTQDQMILMKDLTLQNAHPQLILWYSYFDIQKGDNPPLRWSYLVNAAMETSSLTPTATPPPTSLPVFDASSKKSVTSNTTMSWSHTTTATSNRLLAVSIHVQGAGVTVSRVRYAGSDLTKAGNAIANCNSITNQCDAGIWYMIAPASGANTIQVDVTGGTATAIIGGAVTFSNVDQTTPVGTPATVSQNTSVSPNSVTVNSTNTGQMVVDSIADTGLITPNSPQVQVQNVVAGNIDAGASYRTGVAGSTTMTWTPDYSRIYAMTGLAINPSAVTPTNTPSPVPTTAPTLTPTPTPVLDTTPPTVTITSPRDGKTVSTLRKITLSASATDNVGVTEVDFLVNGTVVCSDTTAPYTCFWVVPSQAGITYTITAQAYDGAGNAASNSVQVKAVKRKTISVSG